MSTLRVTNLKGGSAGSAPNLPDGAVITGVATVGVLSATTFYGSGANLTGIDATALKDSGGSVKVQANSDGAVITGVLTATTGSFTGNISVGGTLTYEDVTNVDSVGMVTARNGVKVLAGGINAVGVVTATSFTGSGANLTGIDALPSVSGTASGAITANRAAMLKTDGTYEAVIGVNQALGSVRSFFDPYRVIAGAYNPDLSNFAFLYQDTGNSNYTTSVVGSISGTTITWGTPQVVRSENPGRDTQAMTYDPTYDRYVGVICQSSNSYKPRIALGTASGTSISWDDTIGTPNFTGNTFCDYMDSCYNTKNNRHGLCWCNSSGQAVAAEYTVTTNSVTVVGSDYAWSGSGYTFTQICWDSTNECYLVASSKQNNGWYGGVRLMNPGQFASPPGNQWDVGGGKKPYGLEHDPNAGQTCLLYVLNGGNLYLQSTTSVNTTTGAITAGTAVQVNSGSPDGGTSKGAGMTYDPNSKKFVITYCYGSAGTGGTWVRTASVNSAGVITLDDVMTLNAGGVYADDSSYRIANVFDTNVNKVATVYQDSANMIGSGGNAGFGKVITSGSTNLDASRYIGFAAESVTNGQTVKVKTKSNTVTQAGLTTATRYYVQTDDGSVGTTAGNPSIDVGISLNSNTVLLQ